MRAKKMQAMIKEMTEKGVSTSDIAKALFTADRKARTERNTSDRRRKVWRTLNDVKPGVSYQQMTACVWDFMGKHKEECRAWLTLAHPDLVKSGKSTNEIPVNIPDSLPEPVDADI